MRLIALTTLALALLAPAACARFASAPERSFRALVFTKTTGYRHDSIPDGVAAIQRLGRGHRFTVDATANAAWFTPRRLARYDVVIFLSTTGTPLAGAPQRSALRGYIRKGGGFVGIHAASDTRGDWPWYERLVGARFTRHASGTPSAVVRVEDRSSAATRGLPAAWRRTDEWYEFSTNPRGRVHVLATVDESSYAGGAMGADHPIAWCHRYDGGRSVYTAMGHTKESFAEPRFTGHLLGAIEMAAGRARFDCGV
jgi:type 1 glutamine amidotransferase